MTKNLVEAVIGGDLVDVVYLIAAGVDLNERDEEGKTPLYYASANARFEIFKTLLENGADPFIFSLDTWAPLHVASFYGHDNEVSLLLQKGLPPDIKNGARNCPLHLSARYGHVNVVERLIAHGANVNEIGNGNRTPLHYACEYNRKDVVRVLLRHGANVEALNDKDQKPLDVARVRGYGEVIDIMELYHLVKGASLDACKTLVDNAAKTITYPSIQKEAITNVQMQYLFTAIEADQTEIVSFLDDHNIDPNTVINGDSLLQIATSNGHDNVVRLLLDKGASPDKKNKRGYAALHYAAINGNESIVNTFLEHNAEVNVVTTEKQTPLHLACAAGQVNIVQILVRNGADINALNEDGETPPRLVKIKQAELLKIADTIQEEAPLPDPDCLNSDTNLPNRGSSLDCTCTFNTRLERIKNAPVNRDSTAILETGAIRQLTSKMDELSALILEINDLAVNLNQYKVDLGRETLTLANLEMKEENTRHLKYLKSSDLRAQANYDKILKELPEKIETTTNKLAKQSEEFRTLLTDVYELKVKKKKLFLDLGELLLV